MRAVPAPFDLQRRAWARAYVLREDHFDDLSLEERINVEVIYRAEPSRLGWAEIALMIVLYRQFDEIRI